MNRVERIRVKEKKRFGRPLSKMRCVGYEWCFRYGLVASLDLVGSGYVGDYRLDKMAFGGFVGVEMDGHEGGCSVMDD